MGKRKITPTQRTESWLREHGYLCGTVERFIHPNSFIGNGYRRDLFGCIDIVAIRPGRVLAVQSTGTDWSGHWHKLVHGDGTPGMLSWLETGQPMILIGWRKQMGGWAPRVHWFLASDCEDGNLCDMQRHRPEREWALGLR